eukprot:TRINITY_DN5599_c0_g1_i1.p1 TRINITY_DN5599_c0_g1~~TRINITY_DN5599_c0_g1_i1.p1  ORF type:complete len:119 (-),score=36.28 TRINITY_DN5599_c0_g1_i1:37-345(-)
MSEETSFLNDLTTNQKTLLAIGGLSVAALIGGAAYYFLNQEEEQEEGISSPSEVQHVQHVTRTQETGELKELDFDADKEEYKQSLKLRETEIPPSTETTTEQ